MLPKQDGQFQRVGDGAGHDGGEEEHKLIDEDHANVVKHFGRLVADAKIEQTHHDGQANLNDQSKNKNGLSKM